MLVIEAHLTMMGIIGAMATGELDWSTSLPCFANVIADKKKGTIIQIVVLWLNR